MRILVTGATGVLGREVIPALVADGHEVTAVHRPGSDRGKLEEAGARPLMVDLFDARAVDAAMSGVETVVHYATAIPPLSSFSKRQAWATNDRLRDEATSLLVDAALDRGVGRFVQESITFLYADGDDEWLDEGSPVAPGWDILDSALAAEGHVDRFRRGGGTGVVLRLSRLYGPGGASSEFVAGVRDRKIPVVGDGANFVSSLHVGDAATALVAALHAPTGVYNVTDDEPVTAERYTSSLASLMGSPAPRRIPRSAARMALGKAATLLTTSQRVSNRHFRETTGWAPRFASVIDGWPDVIEGVSTPDS
jgi:nucleoside-diphosphate-sugar epimerase